MFSKILHSKCPHLENLRKQKKNLPKQLGILAQFQYRCDCSYKLICQYCFYGMEKAVYQSKEDYYHCGGCKRDVSVVHRLKQNDQQGKQYRLVQGVQLKDRVNKHKLPTLFPQLILIYKESLEFFSKNIMDRKKISFNKILTSAPPTYPISVQVGNGYVGIENRQEHVKIKWGEYTPIAIRNFSVLPTYPTVFCPDNQNVQWITPLYQDSLKSTQKPSQFLQNDFTCTIAKKKDEAPLFTPQKTQTKEQPSKNWTQ